MNKGTSQPSNSPDAYFSEAGASPLTDAYSFGLPEVSRSLLSGIIASATDAIIAVDSEQRVLIFNPAAEVMFQCTAHEALGQPLDRFLLPPFQVHYHQQVNAKLPMPARLVQEVSGRRAKGEVFPLEASFAQGTAEGRPLYIVILRDITDRKHSLEAAHRLAAIVESSNDAIIGKTLDGIITNWNASAEHVYGYAASEVIGLPITVLLPRDGNAEEIAGILRRIRRGERVEHFETRRRRKDGAVVTVSLTVSPIKDSAGLITGASIIARDISAQKRAEEALRESEEKFRLLVEHTPAAVAMFDRAMRYLAASHRWLADFGLTAAIIGGSHYEIFPEISEQWKEIHRRCLAGAVEKAEEDRFQRADGAVQWLRWEVRPWTNSAGAIGGLIIFSEDITERKQAEQLIQEKNQLLEQTYDAIFIWDIDDGISYWHPNAARLYGYSEQEARGQPAQDLLKPVWPKPSQEFLRDLREKGFWEGELLHTTKAGEEVVVESRMIIIRRADNRLAVLETLRDVTARRQAEEKVRQSEAILAQAGKIAHLGAWQIEFHNLADINSNPLRWSDETFRIFGYQPGEVTPTNELFFERVHPADRRLVGEAFARAVAECGVYRIEHRVIRPDGSERIVLEHAEPFFDDQGQLRKMIGSAQDITERKRAEELILRMNEMLEQRVAERTAQLQAAVKELEAFSYSVSHDLRAPLRHISGFSQALLEDYGDKLEAEGKYFLEQLQEGSQEMAQLIDDLLQLSRVTRSVMRRTTVNLSELAREVITGLQQQEPARVMQVHIADDIKVAGDKRLLRVVLVNLLGNAWKFTRRRAVGEIALAQKIVDGQRVFCVRDNGAGFDMAFADKLFGAFQRLHRQTDFDGTGIGLATVQRIITRHGGQVWAESAVEQGAMFYFTLPDLMEMA